MAMITPPSDIEFPTLAGLAYAWLRALEDAGPHHDEDDHHAVHTACVAALADVDEAAALLHLVVVDAAEQLRRLPITCPCGSTDCPVVMAWLDPTTGHQVPIEQAIPDLGARLVTQAVFALRNHDPAEPFLDQVPLVELADRTTAFRAATQLRRQFARANRTIPPTHGDPT